MTLSTPETEKRLSHLRKEVLKRGFDRHLTVLKNISDLPPELQAPAVEPGCQTILYFPPQIQHGWNYVPKQAMLFTTSDVTHLMASIWPEEGPQVTHLKGSDLMIVKATLILLYGFLEIVAQGDSSPTRLGVEFNTVAWQSVSPPLRQLLKATQTVPGATADKSISSADLQLALEALPVKFSNGAKIYGLLPGEVMEALVFQPGSSERWLLLLKRRVTANTLLILTSNYVVVIQDDLKVPHGWIISYLPRCNISGIQSRPRGLLNELSILLKRGDQPVDYTLLLEGGAVEAWREQWVRHGGQWEDLPEEEIRRRS